LKRNPFDTISSYSVDGTIAGGRSNPFDHGPRVSHGTRAFVIETDANVGTIADAFTLYIKDK